MKELIKSRDRVREHAEVLTPDFIVEDMLNLVKNETERIESRFLEPACGDGNFLVRIIERKMDVLDRRYRRSQFDYEKSMVIAVGSVYGVDLLDDNVREARNRLCEVCTKRYTANFKGRTSKDVLDSVEFVLGKNIIQGNALDLKNKEGQPIIFSEWSAFNGSKIKRRDFEYIDLADFEANENSLLNIEMSDEGEVVFSPRPIKDYAAVSFMRLHNSYGK